MTYSPFRLPACAVSLVALLFLPSHSARADATDADVEELKSLGSVHAAPADREDSPVTSVGRKTQRASESAAAIYVITADDLRRSGVTSIPEALRLAPGVQVARVDSNKWAISARGFNGVFANKLLVLIDGREVYNPGFGGVYWDAQDLPLSDVERIEVIRGPGASLWGANAVNGVINIISRHARDTQGGQLTAGGGSYDKGFGSLRHGVQLGDHTYARAHAKGFARGGFESKSGTAPDDWSMSQFGFRIDHDDDAGDRLSLVGNAFQGDLNQQTFLPAPAPRYNAVTRNAVDTSGFNLLGRWSRVLSMDSEISVQAYYDHIHRVERLYGQERDTFDLEFQHRFLWDKRHDITWGAGYRLLMDRIADSEFVSTVPSATQLQLFSAFLQDDFALIEDQLTLTLGAKLQHNDFTGFEGQPTIRLLWSPNAEHKLWGAISRAVRTPTRADVGATAQSFTVAPATGVNTAPFPVTLGFVRNPSFRAETLLAYELGYRFQPRNGFAADLALFYNRYGDLQYLDLNQARISLSNGMALASLPLLNGLSADAYGAELSVDWKPIDVWKLQLAYQYLNLPLAASQNQIATFVGSSPRHQGYLRSSIDLTSDLDFDLWLRYVGRVSLTGTVNPLAQNGVPGYLALDARLAWRALPGLELSVVGQNLLDPKHPEFVQEILGSPMVQVPRSFYLQASWAF